MKNNKLTTKRKLAKCCVQNNSTHSRSQIMYDFSCVKGRMVQHVVTFVVTHASINSYMNDDVTWFGPHIVIACTTYPSTGMYVMHNS